MADHARLYMIGLVSVLLAGCVTSTAPGEDSPPTAEAASTLIDWTMTNATMPGGAQVPIMGTYTPTRQHYEQDVSENASTLIVELVWTNTLADLDLVVTPPEQDSYFLDTGEPGNGDTPITERVDEPKAGTWIFDVTAKSAAATDYQLAIALFGEARAPDDYSAFH